ncbi:arsenate reductase family protein [Gemella sp. zg-570]|uniref:arsenate reductase family protein n=1 Tax=Gemella sp. zg-570 TaxID=2840371 RepID=UPI001C0AA037|nr:arsenate reductase family protein [Gemella sp. zg-570]QWQ38817.1 arsenate reductase family protein [Gemella sp. zg-570]
MKIYEYPKCSTCRAAKKFIKNNDIDAEFIDVTKQTPTKEDIKNILKNFGVPIKKLFNSSGILYREGKLKEILPNLSLDEQIDLLLSDGMLIKRPLAFDVDNEVFLLGFKEEEWEKQIK